MSTLHLLTSLLLSVCYGSDWDECAHFHSWPINECISESNTESFYFECTEEIFIAYLYNDDKCTQDYSNGSITIDEDLYDAESESDEQDDNIQEQESPKKEPKLPPTDTEEMKKQKNKEQTDNQGQLQADQQQPEVDEPEPSAEPKQEQPIPTKEEPKPTVDDDVYYNLNKI